jgi:hypothetical protein
VVEEEDEVLGKLGITLLGEEDNDIVEIKHVFILNIVVLSI